MKTKFGYDITFERTARRIILKVPKFNQVIKFKGLIGFSDEHIANYICGENAHDIIEVYKITEDGLKLVREDSDYFINVKSNSPALNTNTNLFYTKPKRYMDELNFYREENLELKLIKTMEGNVAFARKDNNLLYVVVADDNVFSFYTKDFKFCGKYESAEKRSVLSLSVDMFKTCIFVRVFYFQRTETDGFVLDFNFNPIALNVSNIVDVDGIEYIYKSGEFFNKFFVGKKYICSSEKVSIFTDERVSKYYNKNLLKLYTKISGIPMSVKKYMLIEFLDNADDILFIKERNV